MLFPPIERSPGQDLAPTASTLALLSLLKDLLNSSTVIEEKPEQHEEIVGCILDPLSQSLNLTVASFPSTDQDVYLLNSLYQIHTTLALFKFNDTRLTKLENEMDLHIGKTYALKKCDQFLYYTSCTISRNFCCKNNE